MTQVPPSDSEIQAADEPREKSDTFEQAYQLVQALRNEIQRVVIGQQTVVEQVLLALIARGHVLIEGVPGLGKTLLVRTLAQCFGGRFARIQFTPDLMPSDVTGHAMFNMKTQEFEIRKGPAFTNLLLADEINRAPAKTQAALLEVMQEGQITIEGTSHPVDAPFMVLATQNPIEQEGTYPLPEAELDRFMLKVLIQYPEAKDEETMLLQLGKNSDEKPVRQLIKPTHVLSLQKIAQQITVDPAIVEYIVKIVRATRNWPGVSRGAGPRASIALLNGARAYALMNNDRYVTPDDVKAVVLPALRHRLLLAAELEIEGVSVDQVLQDISKSVPAPRK
ncbi:MoxR family ATPase [Saccharophagus sp. K07]|jgi:MoxR-like ATPase|uniref:AAA family ATPase n=1 Tax=Saccharophagus sp. K07 TaxID=2283636 RepID=UPI0016522040|nr:MoxR family ATPase [Saccharophagus sp. K07]MBC6904107.1 MoxR family ATPase [Saccharophagus sp. K07]